MGGKLESRRVELQDESDSHRGEMLIALCSSPRSLMALNFRFNSSQRARAHCLEVTTTPLRMPLMTFLQNRAAPHYQRCFLLFIHLLNVDTGLSNTYCTWAGVFAAETVAVLRFMACPSL